MSNMRKGKVFIVLQALILVLLMTTVAFADDSGLSTSQVKAIKPTGTKAATYTYSRIRVSWDAIDGIDGYQVYRATSENGKYTKAYTTSNPEKNWYINTNRITGKTYYYKVRGYKVIDGKTTYTKYSPVVSTYARPNKVKNVSIGTSSSDEYQIFLQFDVRWDAVKGAHGYQVYISEQGANDYQRVGNYKGTYANFDIPDKRKLYDIKVRSYRIVNGKKVYGYFSKVTNYESDWTADMLKTAAEDYLVKTFPGIILKDGYADGTKKNPWNGTVTWSVVWPKIYCYYEAWEVVKADLEDAINFDAEIQEGLNCVCMYLDPEHSEPNCMKIYLIM